MEKKSIKHDFGENFTREKYLCTSKLSEVLSVSLSSLSTFLLVDGGDIIELLLLDGGDMRHELLDNDDLDDSAIEPKKVGFHS